MITIKTPEEIRIMAEGGKILAGIMKELEKRAKPGITTGELDRVAETLIFKYGAKCSFKGYQGFPACLCVSLNEEIVHAAPSGRRLKEGDIISLDLGILYKGFHADMAVTLPVGKISKEAKKLIEVTKEALKIGIQEVKPGNYMGDVGYAIQKYVESQALPNFWTEPKAQQKRQSKNLGGQGFNVVRELCGHGIGKELHEDPQILNFGKRRSGIEIKEGMTFCLEPMVTVGDWKLKKTKDGHGFETLDGSLSAHFEYMVAVTKDGCRVLTE